VTIAKVFETGRQLPRRVRTLQPLLLAITCVGALAGCGGLFHSNARPEEVYYLRATPIPQGATPVAASLRFARQSDSPGIETWQIVLVQPDRRMSFFLGARWPAAPANLVEMLGVEKLRGSGFWQSVTDSTSFFPSDYIVQVTVRRFEADYTDSSAAPVVHVMLDCVVGKREGRDVIKSFLAESSVPATANKLSAVVAAFETATNAALDSLSTQTLDAVRTAMANKSND
jgi:cholesterol transport system auxiliary component